LCSCNICWWVENGYSQRITRDCCISLRSRDVVLPVIAEPVYTYRGDFNFKIPTGLDTGKGCRANAEEKQGRKVVLICKKTSI